MTRTVMLAGIGFGLTILGTPGIVTLGTAYSFTFRAFGGVGPYVFKETGSLPSGVTFTDNGNGTATIAGTTSAPGNFPITVTLSDSTRTTITANYTLIVQPLPLAITNSAPSGTSGTAYSFTYAATGGLGPYTWSITSGSLPPGLSLNSSTGAVTGTPTTSGTYPYTVTVTDSLSATANESQSVSIAYSALAVSGSFYPYQLSSALAGSTTISGGLAPYSVSVLSGATPSGISFGVSGSTCTASGSNTTIGAYSWTLRYSSTDGQHVDVAMSMQIGWYAKLYTGIEHGLCFDLRYLPYLFKDTAGTVPCTAAGDQIKSIRDLMSGTTLLVYSSGTAPTLAYDSTNGVYYGQWPASGAPQFSCASPSVLGGDHAAGMVQVGTWVGTDETGMFLGANATGGCLAFGNGATFSGLSLFQQGAGHGVGAAAVSGQHTVIGNKIPTLTQLNLYLDGSLYANTNTAAAANITVNTFQFGYYPSAAGYEFHSKWYTGAIIDRPLTSTEIAYVQAHTP